MALTVKDLEIVKQHLLTLWKKTQRLKILYKPLEFTVSFGNEHVDMIYDAGRAIYDLAGPENTSIL